MIKVEIVTCPRGDWVIVKVNGETYSSGHDLSLATVCDLLRELSVEVVLTEISDDEMEAQS